MVVTLSDALASLANQASAIAAIGVAVTSAAYLLRLITMARKV